VAPTLNAKFGDKMGLEDQHALNGAGMFVPEILGALTTRSGTAMGARDVEEGVLVPEVSYTLNAGGQARMDIGNETVVPVAHALRGEGFDASEDGTGRGTPLVPIAIQERAVSENMDAGPGGKGIRTDGAAYTLEARTVPQAVAFAQNQRDELRLMDVAGALASEPGMKQQTYLHTGWRVRRLTPTECERLQGFPDGYTAIPYRNKTAEDCPDGPRYKALGNSMAVNAMRWIGQRIQMVDAMETTHV
jgi:DNA (cytosine-5)-methyltransferase 1